MSVEPLQPEMNEAPITRAQLAKFTDVITKENLSAELAYFGTCVGGAPALKFPLALPSESEATTKSAIEQMFGTENDLVVTERRNGRRIDIRPKSGMPPLLLTRVSTFTPSPVARYNADLALDEIMDLPEVRAYRRRWQMKSTLKIGGLETPPFNNLPHLNALYQNVSVDDLISDVLDTFSGTVVYGECQQKDIRRSVAWHIQ